MRTLLLFVLLLGSTLLDAQQPKKGEAKAVQPNDNVSYGKLKKGMKTGRWRTYDINGVLVESAEYHKGKLNGADTAFYATGKIHRIDWYIDGKRNFTSIEYNIKGDTLAVENYAGDSLNGYYSHYYHNGALNWRGYYRVGRKEGLWKTTSIAEGTFDSSYYSDGQLNGTSTHFAYGHPFTVTHYRNGKKEGTETEYSYDGRWKASITNYSNNLRNGECRYFSGDSSTIQVCWYCNDTLCRYDSVWGPNGRGGLYHVTLYSRPGVKSYEEAWNPFVNEVDPKKGIALRIYCGNDGLMDSLLTYFDNGNVSGRGIPDPKDPVSSRREESYHLQEYTTNGRLLAEGEVLYSRQSGTWTWFDSTGAITRKIEFSNGVANGNYTAYYPNGKLKITGKCTRGFLHDSIAVYTPDGLRVKDESKQYREIIEEELKQTPDVKFHDPSSPLEQTPNTYNDAEDDDD